MYGEKQTFQSRTQNLAIDVTLETRVVEMTKHI